VRLIALTGYGQAADRQRSREAGSMRRPFDDLSDPQERRRRQPRALAVLRLMTRCSLSALYGQFDRLAPLSTFRRTSQRVERDRRSP
jgi:hypothetical protein